MKTIIKIFPLFLLLGTFQLSAQDCAYKTNEVDKFTKQRIIETPLQTVINVKQLSSEYAVHLALKSVNEDKYLRVSFDWKTPSFVIKRFWQKKSKVFFNLKNGRTVVLHYGESDYSKKSSSQRKTYKGKTKGYVNSLESNFRLLEGDIALLETSPIIQMRIEIEEGETYDFEILESAKSPLLGIPSTGTRLKKTKPQQYFIGKLACLNVES